MSYILEALKKAQAERQLGSAPTIHAPAAHSAPELAERRRPLVIGVAAGVLLAAGAAFVWRQQAAVPAPSTVAQAPASTAVSHSAAATPAPVDTAAAPAGPVVALVGTPDKPEPPAAKPVKPAEPAPRKAELVAVPAATPAPMPAPARVPNADRPAPSVAAAATPPSPDDSLPTVNGLPEAVRRDLPKLAFGGYMYSPNPADRLVLVDKTLRHEGEELAPGLMLEKLLPRGAVLNFRGYRYRVPF